MTTAKNNTVKNNSTVDVDRLSWKQGKALIKWGASSNGLRLTLPEIKVSKADLASATKIVNGWKTPVKDAIPGVAHWVSVAKTLTELGLTKKNAGMILDGRLKAETMIKRCALPAEVLSLKFAKPVTKEPTFKPAPVAVAQAAPQGMAFFATEKVSPTGDSPAETILKLIAAGLTPAQAMAAVGMK